MAGPKPLAVTVSPKQQELLRGLAHRQTGPQRLVSRAKTILAAAEGVGNEQIAQQLRLHRNTVRTWRQRWQDATEALSAAEAAGAADKVLLARITATLDDALRPGAPGDFSAEQVAQIIAVACEPPEASGRPVTHWSPRELAAEVSKRGIVERISSRTVGRFLKRSRSQAASLTLLAQS